MSIWDDFTDEELFTVLNCDTFKEIKRKFKNKYNGNLWSSYARNYYNIDHNPDFIADSFIYAINDSTSYGLMTLLFIIGSITVQLSSLVIITFVFPPITIVSGIIFLISAYFKNKRETHEVHKEFDLIALKIQCANEIINRKTATLISPLHSSKDTSAFLVKHSGNEPPPFDYKNKNKMEKVRPSLSFGLMAASMLFGTYYCGIAIIIHAFGLLAVSGALLGPIGVGVAVGVGLLFGAYCCYKHYQNTIKKDHVTQLKQYQNEILKYKREECGEFLEKTRNLNPQPKRLSRSSSTPNISHHSDLFDTLHETHQQNIPRNKSTMNHNNEYKLLIDESTPPDLGVSLKKFSK